MDGFEEWYYEKMLVRRTESARRRIACEKIEKIGRLVIVESFESYGSNFVCNALWDRKPMQRTESRRNMMGEANRRDNDSCQLIWTN